ncbi:MAG: hypothetical protein Q7S27_05685 [Nanoarchaeota archaeon]|nr:hypothetical protein [Nanoarchaeota archaeon]
MEELNLEEYGSNDSKKYNTIEFRMSLGEGEMRELFTYLAKSLSSTIRYSINRTEEILVGYSKNNHIYPIVIGVEINGQINPGKEYMKKGCVLTSFNCFRKPSTRSYDKVDGMAFLAALRDNSEGEIQLMNDSKNKVDEFISLLEDRLD